MDRNQLIVELKDKTLILEMNDFGDEAINTEDLLQVQWYNVLGDIITYPVIFNNIGIIKAEIDDLLRETELDFEIFEAEKRRYYRKALVKREPKGRGDGDKVTYPTETEVKDGVYTDREYKVKRDNLNLVKKNCDVIAAMYNAAKSKDRKLDAVSMKLQPKEFEMELLATTINGVIIKQREKLFKDRR